MGRLKAYLPRVGGRRDVDRAVAPMVKNAGTYARLVSAECGAAAIEFGLIASFLSLLLIAVTDLGMGFWQKTQVGNAARAGAQYAIAKGWNQSAITTAVTSATGLSTIQASPTPTQSCGCPNVSSGITAATCGTSCTGGGTAGTYVTVSAQASYSTLFTYPGFSNPRNSTASVVVRIN